MQAAYFNNWLRSPFWKKPHRRLSFAGTIWESNLGFAVKEIPEQVINEVTVSSTRIREALLERRYSKPQTVILAIIIFLKEWWLMAINLGRTLGYPTANIIIHDENKLVPANGIYVAEAEIVKSQ